jgi:hypothetical protein
LTINNTFMATATDSEIQYDEYGYKIPTPEELAKQRADQEAERLKTEQTLKLVGAMNQTVAPLPMTLPTQSTPVGPPLNLPVSRGRMYMGPAMSPQQESAFMQTPSTTSQNLMPPPSGPPASRLERAQATDQPGSRTIGINDEPPYSDLSLANQQNMMRYNAMKAFDAGDRSPETMAAAMGNTRGLPSPMSAAQQLNYSLQAKRLSQDKEIAMEREKRLLNPPATETETIPAVTGSDAVPAQAARSGFLGIGVRPAIPAVPAVAARGERKITRKVQPATPDGSGIPQSFVDYLKAHPESADSFDQKYGKGSAARILGK